MGVYIFSHNERLKYCHVQNQNISSKKDILIFKIPINEKVV